MRRARMLAAGLTLIVGCAAVNETAERYSCRFPWICEGPASAAAVNSQARPAATQSEPRSHARRRHIAWHHRAARHAGRHGSGHAPQFAARMDAALAGDEVPAEEAVPAETIRALVPAWVAAPDDSLSTVLATSPSRGFNLVAEWKRAVGEISVVGAVPTETLKSFNDFPPDDAVASH
jgi:hypothetical protein